MKKIMQTIRSSSLLIAILIFIGINIVTSFIALRLDFSKGAANTLSSSSKKIIKNINKDVMLTFYISSDIPTRLIAYKTDVVDMLQEYKANNPKHITVKIVDPKKDTKTKEEVDKLGIPELPIQQLEQDKYQVMNTYFGLAITYDKKQEVIPQLTDLQNLEYNITSRIYKLTNKEMPQIGIIGLSQSQPNEEDPYLALKSILQEQYSLTYPEILSKEKTQDQSSQEPQSISKDIKTVLVFGDAQHAYKKEEVEKLQNYVKNGGNLILFLDGVTVSDQLTTSPSSHDLFSFLLSYGLNLQKNLILSTSAELVNFGNQTVQYLAAYPLWFKTNEFNNRLGMFTNITQVTFPWASSIQVSQKSGYTYNDLIYSPKQSWEQKDKFTITPQQIPQPNANDIKQFVVAEQVKSQKTKGSITLFSSSRFVNARYLNRGSNNIELLFNMVNDLSSGGALSGIRSRSVSLYPVPSIPNSMKDVFKYGNILLLPLLFGAYGVVRLLRRK